ncbi:MAG: NADH-quinone oxidoreductase subunit NuoB [candidate division NC10 bacterium]|nr:NADH-quinone oxidoreductase subunit NuoB [candidate division NC10 bacterium]
MKMLALWRKIWTTPVVTEPPARTHDDGQIEALARQVDERAQRLLGRSLHIREVDAGSCNGCELEIGALNNPYYDLERFGMHFVASPRHADCLLVTGPVTRNMADPLKRTYDATPDPKIVVAVGDCARDCGIFAGGYGVVGPVSAVVPVDVVVGGCPPPPSRILAGILAALEMRGHPQYIRSTDGSIT